MINFEARVGVLAAEALRNLRGRDLSLCRFLVVLLLEAVIFLMANELVVALEDQIALLAGVVDAGGLLVFGFVGRGAGGVSKTDFSLMELRNETWKIENKNLILEEF